MRVALALGLLAASPGCGFLNGIFFAHTDPRAPDVLWGSRYDLKAVPSNPLFLLDLPFSFVFDVVALPFTLFEAFAEGARKA